MMVLRWIIRHSNALTSPDQWVLVRNDNNKTLRGGNLRKVLLSPSTLMEELQQGKKVFKDKS